MKADAKVPTPLPRFDGSKVPVPNLTVGGKLTPVSASKSDTSKAPDYARKTHGQTQH